jgi:hypothetical protein
VTFFVSNSNYLMTIISGVDGEGERMGTLVVLREPPIERGWSVCYKKPLAVFGGGGDGQREFESRLWPPGKVS